jgi:pimeloyl-ACP methyl ester carboxylesterase
VHIIPGYEQSHVKQRGYKKVGKFFAARNITPIYIDIDWHQEKPATFRNYVDQFLAQYEKEKNTEVYMLGFSYGALIAFLAASKIKPKALILCSLSPYFAEDLVHFPEDLLGWWRTNFLDSDYSFEKLAPRIKMKTYLVVGDVEHPGSIARAKAGKKTIPESKLSIAKGAKHNIGQKEYLETLERLIAKL